MAATRGHTLLAVDGVAANSHDPLRYYVVVDAHDGCIVETHTFEPKEKSTEERERLRALAARFHRGALGGMAFDSAGAVVLVTDPLGELRWAQGDGVIPETVRGALESPAPPRDEALTVRADGRVLFGYREPSGRECAGALNPSTRATRALACVRARSDADPSFSVSPSGRYFALVERMPQQNTLRVYRTSEDPHASARPILHTSETNLYVVPSSFDHVAVDDDGHVAWDEWNDFGRFASRWLGDKPGWDPQNATTVGFSADGKWLVLPDSEYKPRPRVAGAAPSTVGQVACTLIREGLHESADAK